MLFDILYAGPVEGTTWAEFTVALAFIYFAGKQRLTLAYSRRSNPDNYEANSRSLGKYLRAGNPCSTITFKKK